MALASSKTIAKNSVLLFIRTLISIVISLYTSRVVLQVLGVSDYGVYSVVGSVVATVAILNTLLSIAVSRFLTYEMGTGNKERLHETFCSAAIGQIALAILILVLLETVGLYLLNEKLVIDADRMFAAHVVFQLSIAASIITIIRNVYDASVTAHEDFSLYAYLDIFGALLKLGIVFLLMIGNIDKLIFYATLLLAVNIILFLIYWIYCRRSYEECKVEWLLNKIILVRMLKYSGWSMYGNVSKTVNLQGGNMILNIFFGTVVNAANGIAMAIQGVLVSFAYNIITAFRFQIVKAFAAKEYVHMSTLIYRCGKYATALFLVVAIPFFIEMDYVLHLWLTEVPVYTSSFLRLLVIGTLFFLNSAIISISIGASEHVARMNIVNGTLYLIQLPIVYFLFKQQPSPNYLYVSIVPVYILMIISNSSMLKKINSSFSFWRYIKESFIDNLIPIFLVCCIGYWLAHTLNENFGRVVLVSTISVAMFGGYYYLVLFNKDQRTSVLNSVKTKLHLNNN